MSSFGRRPSTDKGPISVSDANEMALRYLARRDYGCQELVRKLCQRGVEAGIAEQVVERLGENNLVSDERFAEAVARYRANNRYGPLRIRSELRHKGVDDCWIDQALEPFAEQWHESAWEWVSRRHRGELDRKAQARLYRSGLQRGFSHDHVMRAIERLRSDD